RGDSRDGPRLADPLPARPDAARSAQGGVAPGAQHRGHRRAHRGLRGRAGAQGDPTTPDPGADRRPLLRLQRERCDQACAELRRDARGVGDARGLLRARSGRGEQDPGDLGGGTDADPARHRRGSVQGCDRADVARGPALHVETGDPGDGGHVRADRVEAMAGPAPQSERVVREALVPVRAERHPLERALHTRGRPGAGRGAGGVMDREAAVALCREKCLKETTVRHLISVEGVMRALAGRFEQDEDLWGLTGLFHGLDQDHTGDDAANHARLAAEWLREADVDERVINGVLAHAYDESRTDLMSRAVVHADAVAGLLVAAALVRPERSAGMKVSSVKKKLKEKAFAPGVNRDEVVDVEESIGLPLDEFLSVSIGGLQLVAPEIGLCGPGLDATGGGA